MSWDFPHHEKYLEALLLTCIRDDDDDDDRGDDRGDDSGDDSGDDDDDDDADDYDIDDISNEIMMPLKKKKK